MVEAVSVLYAGNMNDDELAALKHAIRHLHHADATWIETVPVKETFQGQTVWEGEVEVFDLAHHLAPRCYAWSVPTDAGKRKFTTVLHMGPVVDAITAVRASIASPKNR